MERRAELKFSWIVGLLAVYFAGNILLRLCLPGSLELDEAEQSYYAQFLLGGYGPQPPLYNWLQYGVVQLFGLSLAALTVTKNILLFLTYVFYALAAREVLVRRDLVVVAVLGLLTLPVVSFLAQRDLTHTVAVLLATALFFYSFFLTLNRPTLASFALVGLATGLGLISKYNFAVLPAAAFIAVLMEPGLRRRLLDWRVLVSVAVAIFVVSPHLVWLVGHFDSASAETLDKMTDGGKASRIVQIGTGLLSLAVAVLAFSALTVAVFAGVYRRALWLSLPASSQWTRLIERIVVLSLVAVVVIIVGTGAFNIRERWLAPYLLILPLYLCLKVEAVSAGLSDVEASNVDTGKAASRMLPVAATIMLIVLSSLFLKTYSSQWTGSYSKLNVPFAAFSGRVMEGRDGPPARVLASDRQLAGALRLLVPDVPFSIPPFPNPQVHGIQPGPTLVVWRGDGEADPALPDEFAAFLQRTVPDRTIVPTYVSLPYNYARGDDRYGFGFAWLP